MKKAELMEAANGGINYKHILSHTDSERFCHHFDPSFFVFWGKVEVMAQCGKSGVKPRAGANLKMQIKD